MKVNGKINCHMEEAKFTSNKAIILKDFSTKDKPIAKMDF